MSKSVTLITSAILGLSALAVEPARATSIISTPYSGGGCSGLGCNNRTFYGSLTGRDIGQPFEVRVAMPWVAQFWAENNECFRLTATKLEGGGNALRMILIAPDGLVIRRTFGGGVPENEIVVAYPASPNRTGFWTVIVTVAAGDASEAEFGLSFGRYFTSNTPNCSGDANTYWVR